MAPDGGGAGREQGGREKWLWRAWRGANATFACAGCDAFGAWFGLPLQLVGGEGSDTEVALPGKFSLPPRKLTMIPPPSTAGVPHVTLAGEGELQLQVLHGVQVLWLRSLFVRFLLGSPRIM